MSDSPKDDRLATIARIAETARTIADGYQPPATGRQDSLIANPLLVQELLTAIEDGNYIETSCDLAGISKVAVYDWIKRGENGEHPFDLFAYAVKRASARAEAIEVGKVREAGKDPRFWAASMTYLERRHPDRWARRNDDSASGPKVVVNIGVKDGDVQVQLSEGGVSPSTFALDEGRKADANLLTDKAYASPSCLINGDYVNCVESVPVDGIQSPAGDLDGAPLTQGGGSTAPTAAGESNGPVERVRGGRKKKG